MVSLLKVFLIFRSRLIFSSRQWFWNTSWTTTRHNSPITVTPTFHKVSLSCFLLLFYGLLIITAVSMNTIWCFDVWILFLFYCSGRPPWFYSRFVHLPSFTLLTADWVECFVSVSSQLLQLKGSQPTIELSIRTLNKSTTIIFESEPFAMIEAEWVLHCSCLWRERCRYTHGVCTLL